MRRPLTTPLIAVTALFAITACGARTKIDASGLAGDASPGQSGLDRCIQCLTLECEDLYVQCAQAGPCIAIQTCAQGADGDDSACLCDAAQADLAARPYLALRRCIQGAGCGVGECASLCQEGDTRYPVVPSCDISVSVPECLEGAPDAGATSARSSTAACEACVAGSCGTFADACSEASDCQSYLACLATCSAPGCVTDCEAVHQTGESAADALDVCLGANCQIECAF